MKKNGLGLMLFLFPLIVNAIAVPQSSTFDKRMQSVSYNAMNSTVIKSKMGFVTTIVFDEGESVISAKTGFPDGWQSEIEDNVIYLYPRPVMQKQNNGENEVDVVIAPILKEWDTNLLVRTTKRIYSFDVQLTQDNPAFVVQYRYPQEQAKKQMEINQKRQQEVEIARKKQLIAKSFEQADSPKNWNYFMRVNDKFDSRRIVPDFAYDNGLFTYLGFNSHKVFPVPFVVKDGEEQSLAFNVEIKGNYKIMVIHNVNDKFVLRYGKSVVGIINQSFGKINIGQKNTLSPQVKRVEVHHE
ncbi:TrbG/VirB9 family P-type conjugative transfer protein [Arsenophonus nasoniae]|uniref:TrbG/VirB9 family P-type conjugative transfer protein n=1 Tax=Arsenophonus nasoniae TaxID=638 RepID=A0AA95JZQ3_9GAMM|nr:TrbG/VirB9 family P-type conjugative transfer protein [Arsenophonus nasoniae]WGL93961.1 TrbG/VirB9 family P-type conjugative transfer protein [Arsenophonus nasoniae]